MQLHEHFNRKIVVIDHNPNFLTAMKALLYQAGYTNVTGFEHSDDAYSFIREGHEDIYKTYINLVLYPKQGPELLKGLMHENLSPIGFTMMSDHAPFPQHPIYYTSADISSPIIKPNLWGSNFDNFKKTTFFEMDYIHHKKQSLLPSHQNDLDVSEAYKRRELAAALAQNIPITSSPPKLYNRMAEAIVAGVAVNAISENGPTIYEKLEYLGSEFLFSAMVDMSTGIANMPPVFN